MKILVTGGAGFIGSNLCRDLLEKGNDVVCVDNLLSGDKKNIEDILGHEKFTFMEADICNALDIPCDQIYNLACPASPAAYQKNPKETLLACSLGVENMLNLALKNNVPLLHTSTSEVYGNPLEHPQKESYWGNVNSYGPRSCYDEGKRYAESLIWVYNNQHASHAKIVRIFNTYGPFMKAEDGRVIPNFIKQALNNEPITLYGDGSQTRSFCFISDMVDGLERMMGSKETGPINLGNPAEYTVKEIAEKIVALTRSSSVHVYKELPTDDPLKRRPNTAKAKKLLNWEPNVDLEQGLLQTIAYFKKAA